MTIKISEFLTPEERMTREGGEKLRKKILTAPPGLKIFLDFENKMIASVSFWDEAIAKLCLEGWTPELIRSKIQFIGLHHRDREVMDTMIRERSG